MANNSVAYGRSGSPDVFADDDPLAELARIAGYDERSPLRSAQEQPVRREPAFNLEDELLRELENYDEPRPEPVVEREAVTEPVVRAQVYAEPEMARPAAYTHVPERVSDPFNDEEFDALDRRDPLAHVNASEQFGVAPRRSVVGAVEQTTPAYSADQSPRAPEMRSEPSGLDADLISELETSLLPVEPVQQSAKESRPPARAYEPGFRMPLANFNPASVPRHEPRSSEPRVEDNSIDDTRFNEPQAVAQPIAQQEFANPKATVAENGAAQSDSSVWEEELARVAAFAMAPQQAVRHSPTIELPQVEAFRNEDRAVKARISADLPPVSSIPPLPEFAAALQDHDRPARSDVRESEPTFDSDEFELALDEIEFDLSDILEDEAAVVPARSTSAAAPHAASYAPAPKAAPFTEVVERRADVGAAPSSVAAVPAFLANSRSAAAVGAAASPQASASPMSAYSAPVRAAPQPVVGEDFGDGEAFDPALLADTDEMPEVVPDLNVPEMPAHEPEQRPAQHAEFDIDLDAELASFLTQANAAPVPAAQRGRPSPQAAFATSSEQKPAARPSDGLDDFERALEEDFRRSLQTPFPARATREKDGDDDAIYIAPRKRLSWILPASAAGFAAVIGLSAYAFYAGQGSKLSGDGAPVVIAADTDPVKVAPQNPGGKVVPNQDKAVYDRVATGTLEAPKQPSLISSDEQPVDVVQKTLETLPMETDVEGLEAVSTPVGETEDARLLPQQTANAAVAQDQLAVMPRKVKTMVVRPDGTLVEQIKDVPAKPAIQAPATAVKTEKVPASPALAEPTRTAANTTGTAPVSAETTALADVNIAKASPITGSAAANTVPTTTASTKTSAPVPASRPAEQPVKVVAAVSDQGTVRPTAAPVAPVAASAGSQAGGYYIQVASLPSEADAQKSYKNLSAKFGGLIAGRGVDIAKAEIAGKGTFYRVRIPAGSSKDEAASLCEKLRAAGGTCLIAR